MARLRVAGVFHDESPHWVLLHLAPSSTPSMMEKQKELFELRLKMNVNQQVMVAEKKRMEPRSESRDVSKQKWLEDRKKKIEKLLDSNGLDMSKAYMLDT